MPPHLARARRWCDTRSGMVIGLCVVVVLAQTFFLMRPRRAAAAAAALANAEACAELLRDPSIRAAVARAEDDSAAADKAQGKDGALQQRLARSKERNGPVDPSPGTMHRCMGYNQRETHQISCEFMNLCYANGEFVYYQNPNTSLRTQWDYKAEGGDEYGTPVFAMPNPLVQVANREEEGQKPHWAPKQVTQTIPKHAVWKSGTYLLAKRIATPNYGHLLKEGVLPAFGLMTLFAPEGEWATRDVNFMFLDSCDDLSNNAIVHPHGASRKHRDLCRKFSQELYGLMTSAPLRDKEDVMREWSDLKSSGDQQNEPVLCFETVLAGTGHLGITHGPSHMQGGRGHFITLWRNTVFRRLGLPFTRPANRLRIVVAKKGGVQSHSRDIHNAQELVAHLNEHYTEYNGIPVEAHFMQPVNTPLEDQVRLLSQTDLLISPSGAVGDASPFLPDGAALVLAPYCAKYNCPHQCSCARGFCCHEGDGFAFHTFLPYVYFTTYEVNVGPDEVGGESQSDIIINFDRIRGYIDRALAYSVEYKKRHPEVVA